jgi:rod shape-determining protein MreC
MESFFSRYRNALVLIAVLVAQLLALAVQAKRPANDAADRHAVTLLRYAVVTVITPPERLLHGTGRLFRSVWFGYIDLIHVRRENANLKQELERLRIEQASVAQDAEQGRRLQHMLGFTEHYIYKTLPAQVIGTGGTDQSQVLYIDKGADDGLKQDMPVITPDGIVGKLKDVFPSTSQVLLVTDPTSGAGVILEATRIRGILRGRAYGQLQVADISPDSRIKAGETIVTSGGDQIFPRGLPVGTVDRVLSDPEHDPLVDVLVRPAAKLSQLEEVLVITSMSDEASAQEAKDLAESEAEGQAEQKRASDILSERLPARVDPNSPADTNPEQLVDAAGNALRPAPPPKPEHPDRFSPNSAPDAAEMKPGERWAPVKDGTEEVKPSPSRPKPVQGGATGSTPAASPGVTSPGTSSPGASIRPVAGPAITTAAGAAAAIGASTAPGASPAVGGRTTPLPTSASELANTSTRPTSLKASPVTHVVVDGPETRGTVAHRPSITPVERKTPELIPSVGSEPQQPTIPSQTETPPSPDGGNH